MTWRERLDARVDRCPGCDQWRFDKHCQRCDAEPQLQEEEEAA